MLLRLGHPGVQKRPGNGAGPGAVRGQGPGAGSGDDLDGDAEVLGGAGQVTADVGRRAEEQPPAVDEAGGERLGDEQAAP